MAQITAVEALALTNAARAKVLESDVDDAARRGLRSVTVGYTLTNAQKTVITTPIANGGLGYTLLEDARGTTISW